jgi:hypothetical protein
MPCYTEQNWARQFWANYRKCLLDDFQFKVTEKPEEQLKKFFDAT